MGGEPLVGRGCGGWGEAVHWLTPPAALVRCAAALGPPPFRGGEGRVRRPHYKSAGALVRGRGLEVALLVLDGAGAVDEGQGDRLAAGSSAVTVILPARTVGLVSSGGEVGEADAGFVIGRDGHGQASTSPAGTGRAAGRR